MSNLQRACLEFAGCCIALALAMGALAGWLATLS